MAMATDNAEKKTYRPGDTEFVATCLFGLERLLGEEIEALGYRRTETMDGRVAFLADRWDIPRLNLFLRFAERVYIRLGAFHAETFTELFDGTRALPFENYIGASDAFPVKGHAIKSRLFSVPDCQKIIKKAAVERLSTAYGVTSRFPETGVKYQIEFFLFKDNASVMIDTSGAPLHKRGYRPAANDAPLRETLAAALVKLAHLHEHVLLWDPFCGSGTIPIEAAMQQCGIAPGLLRHFAAEEYPFIPESAWKTAREEAGDLIRRDSTFEAYGSDIDPACVALSEQNAKRAGVEKHVRCFQRDARTIETYGRRGTVICNPPYGERLLTVEQAETLYREMGEAFRSLGSWQIYVLTASEDFERLYRRRADKVRKLYNGMIPCYYYQFFKNGENRKK